MYHSPRIVKNTSVLRIYQPRKIFQIANGICNGHSTQRQSPVGAESPTSTDCRRQLVNGNNNNTLKKGVVGNGFTEATEISNGLVDDVLNACNRRVRHNILIITFFQFANGDHVSPMKCYSADKNNATYHHGSPVQDADATPRAPQHARGQHHSSSVANRCLDLSNNNATPLANGESVCFGRFFYFYPEFCFLRKLKTSENHIRNHGCIFKLG
jgi:hypothetical protein